MITGLAHVNLTVPKGSLEEANAFYGGTLGLTPRTVPQLQKGTLAWYVMPNPIPLADVCIYPLPSALLGNLPHLTPTHPHLIRQN